MIKNNNVYNKTQGANQEIIDDIGVSINSSCLPSFAHEDDKNFSLDNSLNKCNS